MSELVVGSLKGLAANGFVIDVATGSTLDLSAGAVFPAGTILQVVSTTKTDTFTMASTTFADVTGLSVSITPKSTTSKIIVLPYVVGGATGAVVEQQLRLMRDSTPIAIGDAAGSRQRLTFAIQPRDVDSVAAATPIFVDSPNTTSALTYKIQTRGNTANTVSINRPITDGDAATNGRSVSTITLMEVAG
jgi:hypothetical protein